MSRTVEEMRQQRHERWIEDWRKNLTNCRNCDKDYFEADVVYAEETTCPHCMQPLNGKLYYCEEHGGSTCKECDHNV